MTNEKIKALREIGQRLSRLKARSPEQAGIILYTTGALYSAAEAQRCGFTDRSANPARWSVELETARQAAAEIGKGRRPADSSWVSIVHFNNALWRIDVAFERLVRYVTQDDSKPIKKLLPAGLSKGALQRWRVVRDQEVNKLKHRNPSSLTRRRMSYAEMIKALCCLVDEVEKAL
jgi:hypothetical protein